MLFLSMFLSSLPTSYLPYLLSMFSLLPMRPFYLPYLFTSNGLLHSPSSSQVAFLFTSLYLRSLPSSHLSNFSLLHGSSYLPSPHLSIFRVFAVPRGLLTFLRQPGISCLRNLPSMTLILFQFSPPRLLFARLFFSFPDHFPHSLVLLSPVFFLPIS